MKTWLFSLLSFILIILLGLFSQYYLRQSSNRLIGRIDRIDPLIAAGKWERTARRLDALRQDWRRAEPFWAVLIHHQEIDNIDNALIKLVKAVYGQDSPGSRMSSGELRHFLQHIPQRESFTLVNIL
jgi:hypothetical protein